MKVIKEERLDDIKKIIKLCRVGNDIYKINTYDLNTGKKETSVDSYYLPAAERLYSEVKSELYITPRYMASGSCPCDERY